MILRRDVAYRYDVLERWTFCDESSDDDFYHPAWFMLAVGGRWQTQYRTGLIFRRWFSTHQAIKCAEGTRVVCGVPVRRRGEALPYRDVSRSLRGRTEYAWTDNRFVVHLGFSGLFSTDGVLSGEYLKVPTAVIVLVDGRTTLTAPERFSPVFDGCSNTWWASGGQSEIMPRPATFVWRTSSNDEYVLIFYIGYHFWL